MVKHNEVRFNLRHLSAEEEQEVSRRIELLETEGKLIEGTSPAVNIHERPDFFREDRIKRAQDIVNKYYLPISSSSSIGLILLLQLDEILIPLLKTGKSRTVPDLYDRYSATVLYIKKCYETPFYERTSEGWRYVSIIRGMHQRIFKVMNGLEEEEQGDKVEGHLWVNQYDMALTQFAFVGMFLLRPEKCAAPQVDEHELGEIVYFWRLLSHQLGIEDRFNLFVYHDDIAKQLRLNELIFEHFKQKLEGSRNPIGVKMGEGFLLSFEKLTTFNTFNIVERHWFDTISISGRPHVQAYEGTSERWKAFRHDAFFKLISMSELTRELLTRVYKKKVEKFCLKGAKVKKNLAKKYPNHVYDLQCDV